MTGPRATPLPASFAFTVERDGTGYADVRSKADGRLVAKAPDGDMAREIVRRWNAHADLRDALAACVEQRDAALSALTALRECVEPDDEEEGTYRLLGAVESAVKEADEALSMPTGDARALLARLSGEVDRA